MTNKNPKSSSKSETRDLAGTRRPKAKELLTRLVNLPNDHAAYEEFRRRFPYVLDEVSKPLVRHWAMNTEQEDYQPNGTVEEMVRQHWLLPLRDSLRALWCADVETKRWGMFRISQEFFLQGNRDVIKAPQRLPLLLQLQLARVAAMEEVELVAVAILIILWDYRRERTKMMYVIFSRVKWWRGLGLG